jgi:hypothetical protein
MVMMSAAVVAAAVVAAAVVSLGSDDRGMSEDAARRDRMSETAIQGQSLLQSTDGRTELSSRFHRLRSP